MPEQTEEKESKSKWNLSDALIYEIASHLTSASTLYQHREFAKAFFNLKTVVHRLVPYLKLNEITELKEAETNMFVSIFHSEGKGGFAPLTEEQAKHKVSLMQKFDDYNEILMKIIQRSGLYFVVKKDKSDMIT